MNDMGMYRLMEYEAKYRINELMREAALIALEKEAIRARSNANFTSSKALARIGRELTAFGTKLEERFGMQTDGGSLLKTQSNPGDCV